MPSLTLAANTGEVIFNEIAWMGTKANSSDEWIELYNNSSQEIDLLGWKIYGDGGKTLIFSLNKKIASSGYYLIERTDDNTIKDILADDSGSFGGNGLSNKGEYLVLKDNLGNIINQIDFSAGWPAGSASPDYQSMEKGVNGSSILSTSSGQAGSLQSSWQNNNGASKNGIDAQGNLIVGTPRSMNSSYQVSISTKVSDLNKQVESVVQVQLEVNDPTPVPVQVSVQSPLVPIQTPASISDTIQALVAVPAPQSPIIPTQILPLPLPMSVALPSSAITGSGPSILATQSNLPSSIKNDFKNLYISEIMTNPNGLDRNNEWIEIYNESDNLIDLSGFYLISESGRIFTIPNGETLISRGFLVLHSSKTKLTLNNKSGNIKFFTPKIQGNVLLSALGYLNLKEGSSLARNSLGQYQETRIPTPGFVNILKIEKSHKMSVLGGRLDKKDNQEEDYENSLLPINYLDNEELPSLITDEDSNRNNQDISGLAKLPLSLPIVTSITITLAIISLVIIFFLKSKII